MITDGPFYDELTVGMVIPALPGVTFTEADNVLYRAITGDQHRPSCDASVFAAMGGEGTLVNPGLVMQYAVGQSTGATRRAIANLYYRSVRIHRPVLVGETLTTVTTVLGLSDASPTKDGVGRGKVWLGMESRTAVGVVVTTERCALLPCRSAGSPGHGSEIPGPSGASDLQSYVDILPGWELSVLPSVSWEVGEERADPMRDHIDLAAPLARMTFNQALLHRDHTRTAYGQRLVYGGHVQGLAQASLSRMLPGLATVMGWDGCDHLGPAFEGDLLAFRHVLVDALDTPKGRIMRFEVKGRKFPDDEADILKWTAVVLAP